MKFTAAFLALTVASASAFAPASPAARTCEFLIFEMKGSKRYAGLSDGCVVRDSCDPPEFDLIHIFHSHGSIDSILLHFSLCCAI